MQKITVAQLATLLWIKALDDYEDSNFKGLRDKYYNFIENNSVIEDMEVSEFDKNKEFLVEQSIGFREVYDGEELSVEFIK